MDEIIYILTNPGMRGLVKVGRTDDGNLNAWIRELSTQSGVPYPFKCFYACKVEGSADKDAGDIEEHLYKVFKNDLVAEDPQKGFFRVDPARMKTFFDGVSLDDKVSLTTVVESPPETSLSASEGQKPSFRFAVSGSRGRKFPFRFSMVEIPVGAVLHFIEDEAITCRVVGDREVELEGEVFALSEAARYLLNTRFGRGVRSARGPAFWLYEGETLAERRDKYEGRR